MDESAEVIVIGAGLAGIACARMLAGAGVRVALLDKGRGIGGRMATRRVTLAAGAVSFDHGAQYLRPEAGDFAAAVTEAGAQIWPEAGAWVGVPGMSSLPRALAAGLSVTQEAEVTALDHADGRWYVTSTHGTAQAARVILAIPAPQAARLLGAEHPLSGALSQVEFAPALALMAAFPPESARPFRSRRDPDHPLAWIAQESSKPGRSGWMVSWVAQAGPEFSEQYLEAAPDEIAARMLPLLCTEIAERPERALHLAAHRWRYAQTTRPLGAPFLRSAEGSLLVGGDWALGAKAEHAWQSGQAMARAALGHAHA